AQGFYHPQPGPYRSLRVILMGPGIPEVDQEAIAEILGNSPLKATDHLGAGVLVGPDHRAQLLRVELAGERGRVDEITEQHGELTTLGLGRMMGGGSRPHRCRLRGWLIVLTRWRGRAWRGSWLRKAGPAVAAEPMVRGIREPTRGAGRRELGPTVAAEMHPIAVGKPTARAAHAHTPPGESGGLWPGHTPGLVRCQAKTIPRRVALQAAAGHQIEGGLLHPALVCHVGQALQPGPDARRLRPSAPS